MSIEDKLRNILADSSLESYVRGVKNESDGSIAHEKYIAAIKQVFIDEHYCWVSQETRTHGRDVKTGPEWFTAFERELSELRGVVAEDEFEDILEAAKRASGLK